MPVQGRDLDFRPQYQEPEMVCNVKSVLIAVMFRKGKEDIAVCDSIKGEVSSE